MSRPRNPNVTQNILAIDSSYQYCIRGLTEGPLFCAARINRRNPCSDPRVISLQPSSRPSSPPARSPLQALSKPSESRVKFTASGPAGLKIEGTTSELDIADDGTNVVLTVRLANLDTGISIRDKHTKDCLEVESILRPSSPWRERRKLPPPVRSQAVSTQAR